MYTKKYNKVVFTEVVRVAKRNPFTVCALQV